MKLSSALEAHFSCDKYSKFVEYFGQKLIVPKDTIAIATDDNGFINFYQKSIPEIDHGFWFSEDEQEPQGINMSNTSNPIFIEDWKDSLVIL